MQDEFWYQLTQWVVTRAAVYAHEEQLKKYGLKEGKDYVFKSRADGDVAIFTKGSRLH